MRIGFDGGCLSNRRGFGRFARQTLRALADSNRGHEIVVFIDRPSEAVVELPSGVERRVVEVRDAPSRAASAHGRRRVADMLAMGLEVSRSRIDLMYFPASYSFFPLWNVSHVVVTLHDTLALTLPHLVFPSWQGRVAWALKEHAAVRWADRVLAVSEASRRDVIAYFRLDPDRVGVVTEGPDAAFRPDLSDADSEAALRRYDVDPDCPFLLYVGGLSPHKNLPRLLEAFSLGAPEGYQLVLVGDLADVFHTHVPELRATAARLGIDARLTFTGFVPDSDLAHIYRRAYALVQPSLMEGFGLPPVEAMACGTPVLSSRAGSLPEVVGDAGVFFDPMDVRGIAEVIARFTADPEARERFSRVALERARRFSWTESAQALLRHFEQVVANPGETRRSA